MTATLFSRYAAYDAGEMWDGRTGTADHDRIRRRITFVAGTPDQVTEQLQEWIDDLHPVEIMTQTFAVGMRHEDAMRSMKRFASEVMHRFATGPGAVP